MFPEANVHNLCDAAKIIKKRGFVAKICLKMLKCPKIIAGAAARGALGLEKALGELMTAGVYWLV